MVDRYNNTYRSRYYSEISHYSSHPSFSSSLLDSIYRSIDLGEEDKMGIYRDLPNCITTKKKQDHRAANMRPVFNTDEEMANFQRACMIEKWMEKKVTTEKAAVKKSRKDRKNFSSSSSDSSCNGDGGGFFSSAAAVYKPKPVRTGCRAENRRDSETDHRRGYGGDQLPIKSGALKIYGELKKAKQPISPGGKVAAFLNSLFAAANLKKPKNGANCSDDYPVSLKSTNTSSCSSASSFSRSCLIKTPSSRGKSEKRTVRFFVDDKSENNNNNNNISRIKTAINEELMLHIMENNRGVDIDLLKNYQKNNQLQQECDEFDDAESYASSDLFELENLSAIGMERYTEELPVYETTHLHTNRAIANGFIL
ncbi:hypothetical protein BUALT_Bualt02G0123600 [Buddleja alternifolia]|uniref:Protein BIG GRAIN 1-like B n=1 Tax=Buddleja alternifolia TaxID=168488 RepID=A0AAV6XZP5_9LAMI|nr:hypothetical protein BUALT_Bualt02G0123600 [Buddleja alternifolia]